MASHRVWGADDGGSSPLSLTIPSSVAPEARGVIGSVVQREDSRFAPEQCRFKSDQNPPARMKKWGCSSTGRATRLHREGYRFKSDHAPPIAHHDSGSLERGESIRITPVVVSRRGGECGRVTQRIEFPSYKGRVGGSNPSVATSIEGSFNGQDARLIRGQYRFDSCAFNQNRRVARCSHASGTPYAMVFLWRVSGDTTSLISSLSRVRLSTPQPRFDSSVGRASSRYGEGRQFEPASKLHPRDGVAGLHICLKNRKSWFDPRSLDHRCPKVSGRSERLSQRLVRKRAARKCETFRVRIPARVAPPSASLA